jgi:hypothetical protein
MRIGSAPHLSILFFAGLSLATGLARPDPVAAQTTAARSVSPFANFLGNWQGTGEVVGTDGARERIRCRANYDVSDNGLALTQTLVCASASYRVDVSSYVEATGQSARGYWREATRQAQGSLTGNISDGLFVGTVSGPNFTAQLSLKAADGRQTVDIRPQGANVARIAVELSRQG